MGSKGLNRSDILLYFICFIKSVCNAKNKNWYFLMSHSGFTYGVPFFQNLVSLM